VITKAPRLGDSGFGPDAFDDQLPREHELECEHWQPCEIEHGAFDGKLSGKKRHEQDRCDYAARIFHLPSKVTESVVLGGGLFFCKL